MKVHCVFRKRAFLPRAIQRSQLIVPIPQHDGVFRDPRTQNGILFRRLENASISENSIGKVGSEGALHSPQHVTS